MLDDLPKTNFNTYTNLAKAHMVQDLIVSKFIVMVFVLYNGHRNFWYQDITVNPIIWFELEKKL